MFDVMLRNANLTKINFASLVPIKFASNKLSWSSSLCLSKSELFARDQFYINAPCSLPVSKCICYYAEALSILKLTSAEDLTLGYVHFRARSIEDLNGRCFRLVFVSKIKPFYANVPISVPVHAFCTHCQEYKHFR